MKVQQNIPAGENSRFAPTAFDNQIGVEVPLKILGILSNKTMTLLNAKVIDKGRSAILTWEMPDSYSEEVSVLKDYSIFLERDI